jgi:hypothetical protein
MKKQILNFSILMLIILLRSTIVHSQSLTQTIRGKVLDEDSKTPLIGVNVLLLNSNPLKGTVTDVNGDFRLDNIPLGRVDLQFRYIGYEEKNIPNILVSSGKEVILSIEMKESVVKMDEVIVTAQKNKGDVVNEMAIISSRSFSVEETKRYAGALQDPSRMVSAYAGVTSDPNGNNDIVVRGNSPKGILWRLEGIEIPNPNHFADEGSTGGAINALNSELLSNSDFYTGAFSPEYGDALSGVFDMKMRTGNNEKYEYSLGVGILGTDVTAEGPFRKGYAGSFLFNYRYSSLSLLDKAGLVDFDGVPKYQDAAFKVVLPTKKLGTLSLFGLGGKSSIYEEQTESDESDKVVERTDYGALLGVIGLNHTLSLNQNTFVKLTLSASNNGSNYNSERNDNDNFVFDGKGNWEKNSLRAALTYSSKIDARNRLMVGVKFTDHLYDMDEYYFNEDHNRFETGIDLNKSAGDIQGYASWKFRQTDEITWVGGLHTTWFSLNRKMNLEPRLALRWQISPKQAINAGFGMHSKIESIVTYYSNIYQSDGSYTTPNKKLGLSKARHYVLGYEYRISKNLNSKLDLYYQDLYNIPVENVDTSSFSILNSDEGYVDKELVNSGRGRNLGIEYTLEKYFDHNYYFLVTASLYDSKYKALDNIYRNTKYNGNYALNFLSGKDFRLGGGDKANMLSVNVKLLFNGGRRYIPVNLEASKVKGETVYDYSQAWKNKLDNLKQLNLAVSYRINRPKTSHEFVLDFLNVTNAKARNSEYYNKYTGNLEYYRQLDMIPNILYRIHF